MSTSSNRISIVVLACHGLEQHALINHLSVDHEIAGIVFEDRKRTLMRAFANRLRRLGTITVLNQLIYKILDEMIFKPRSRSRARQILGEDASFRKGSFPNTTVVETLDVNSRQTINLIKVADPDVVVVSGVSLLDEVLLTSIGDTTVLNIHCGITPRYRGSHGAFWAIVNKDWENAGTTVHVIDRGVDTGPIVGQKTIDPAWDDDPRFLAFKQNIVGTELVIQAIDAIRSGVVSTIERPDLDSRIFSSPSLTAYFAFRKNMRERFTDRLVSR